jgi:hypothetical protein
MHRRSFVCTGATALVALVSLSQKSRAFQLQRCDDVPGNGACAEAVRHQHLVAQLKLALADEKLDPATRQALRGATCPFCGQPLLPSEG